MLERMQRKGKPSTLLVGMQTGAVTVENIMEIPEKWTCLLTQLSYFWEYIQGTQNTN